MGVLLKLASPQSRTQGKGYVHLTALKWAGGVVTKLFTFVLPAIPGYRGVGRWFRQNLSLLLLLVPVLLYLPAILWFQLPNQYAVVMSGSMEPAYSAGDLVILRPIKDAQVGDVVAFSTPRGTPGFPPRLLHRVVEYDREGARLITKGDANPDSDPFKVGLESLLGEATGFKVPSGGHIILFLQSRYGKIWIAIMALGFAYPTIVRMGTWTRRSAQRALTETIGLETGRLERVESGVDETRDALVQFSRAIAEYATHLQSHTTAVQGMSEGSQGLVTAVQGMSEGSQGLVAAVQAQNEVLAQLKEMLGKGEPVQNKRPPVGQKPAPRRRQARKLPPGHRAGHRRGPR
jgi:signal peptidase